MALGWKLVLDAGDPHRHAVFWAQALGYQIEDNSPLIEQLLAAGTVEESLCVEFQGRLFWRDAAAVRHSEDPFDSVSGTGLGRRLLFNRRTPIASRASRRARFFGRGAGLARRAHRLPTPSRA